MGKLTDMRTATQSGTLGDVRRLLLVLAVLGVLVLPFGTSAEGGIKTIINTNDIFDGSSSDPGTTMSFSDVDETAWYAPYVDAIVKWNLASGYRDVNGGLSGLFGPGDQVTVAQLLKMALVAGEVDLNECGGLPDLEQAIGHWSERYVACGESLDMRILRRQVDLDRPVLRGEALGMIHDALGLGVPDLASAFPDTDSHLYKRDIAYDAARKIVSGMADAEGRPTGLFEPNKSLTRAEISKILYLTILTTGASVPESSGNSVNLTATNFSFKPTTIVVQKDTPVTIHVHTTGQHSLVIPDLDVSAQLTELDTTVSFTPHEAGSFEFHCGMPGHEDAGMVGTLIVK